MYGPYGPRDNQQNMLELGYGACRVIEKGYSDDQIVDSMVAVTRVGRVDAGNLIASARDQLCFGKGKGR